MIKFLKEKFTRKQRKIRVTLEVPAKAAEDLKKRIAESRKASSHKISDQAVSDFIAYTLTTELIKFLHQ